VTVVAGRYRLLTRIGKGGMGVVWRAYDELLRRDVALKELHVRVGVDNDLHSRQVLREARAAARLRHPGVVAVHDVIVDDGRPLILMELVEGSSLAERVRQQGPLSEQRVAEIGARLLEALAVAHSQGVVHRDVKPGNILLNGDRVVLTDFGIAAIRNETTASDTMVGSLDYMAPERVNGEPATPASDVWSLGVTLCTALCGESPFQRADAQTTLAAVLTHEPPPVPQAPRLWRVLAMLLRKDPRQRLTAAAASAMLAAIASVPRAPAEPTGPPRPPAEPPRPSAEQSRPRVEPVVQPDTARVVEPLTESPTGGRARARRMSQPLPVLLAVLILLVAGVIWLVVRPAGNVAGTATGATAASSVPSGFTTHRGDGYTIAIPKGWFKDPRAQDVYWVSDPHSPRYVVAHLEWWDRVPPGGALGVLNQYERGEFIDVDVISNYKRLKLGKISAARGTTRAEMEVAYHVDQEGGFDLHELMRAFATPDGRTYLLTVSSEADNRAAAERLWRTEKDDLTAILDGFRITPS